MFVYLVVCSVGLVAGLARWRVWFVRSWLCCRLLLLVNCLFCVLGLFMLFGLLLVGWFASGGLLICV